MWDALVLYKTRRDCTNYVYVLRKMQGYDLVAGKDVEAWITEMEGMRRRLEELGQPLPDEQYAELLKTTIARTRRTVLMYLQSIASARSTPVTADEILRELRVEDELDKHD